LFRLLVLPALSVDGNKAPGLALQVNAFSQRNTRYGIQDSVIRLLILSIIPIHVNNGSSSPDPIEMKIGDVMHEAKDVQEPHHHHNDHDRIQKRFNGARHGNEGVDEPEKYAHHDQGNADLH
jgi:hypothetical protein